jgi:hypothetical protein
MVGSGASVDLPHHNLVPPRRFEERDFYKINPEPGVWMVHDRNNAPRQVSGFRELELEWRRTHAETLRQYENEWVVLEGEQIIAHGPDAAEVIQQAREKGIKKPFVFFVEQKIANVVTIGL